MSTPQQQRGSGSARAGQEYGFARDRGSYFDSGMRDRQARGKNPYGTSRDEEEEEEDEEREEGSEGSEGGRKMRLGQGFSSDSFEDREMRAFALSVLDNREQLMMYAQSTNDSIPGQRHRFTAMLCGFEAHPQHQHKHEGSKAGSSRETASGQKTSRAV